MGTNMKELDVVMDTSSEWLVVKSADCFTCTGRKGYDTQTSLAFKKIPGSYGERVYGTAYTTGDVAIDSVCIASQAISCTKSFKWFLVDN